MNTTSRDAIKLQLLLAAALKGISLECDTFAPFTANVSNSAKCDNCGEEYELHN